MARKEKEILLLQEKIIKTIQNKTKTKRKIKKHIEYI